MAWDPAKAVLDLTPIADNFLGYVEEFGMDAINWASNGADLEDFHKLYTNSGGRLATDFPSLMILTQECEIDLSGELLRGEYQLVLEGTVGGPDTDELVLATKMYAKAVGSLIMNIPTATLVKGTDPLISAAALQEFGTVFDLVRGVVNVSGFVQVFQVRSKYAFIAEAF